MRSPATLVRFAVSSLGSCSSDGIVVVSPGRDQKPGTADDVRVPRG